MSKSSKAAKSVFIIIVLGLGSKLLGFLREMLIAAKFGSGIETDTFFVALTATSLFTAMFTQSLNTIMIPILSDIELNEGDLKKKKHINNLINIIISVSVIMIITGWFVSPLIIKILAYGFVGDQFKLAVSLLRIGLPVILFSGVLGIFRGYLQKESMFLESSLSQFPYNISYIIFLLFFASLFGIKGLMITSVIAVFTQVLFQIPSIKKTGFSYEFIFNIYDSYVVKSINLILPVLVSVAIIDLNKIVDRSLASTLETGSISALSYSARLNVLVLTIFITAIATVLFPLLSEVAGKKLYEEYKKLLISGVNTILLITIPATIGIILLSEPIVKFTFQRGAFDSAATTMTSQALIFYSLGLVGMALRTLMERAYYSLQDTRTPMINGFFAVGINITLNIILIGPMAHRGLALATSIAITLTSGLLIYGLREKIGRLGFRTILICGLKSLLSSCIMGFTVYLTYYHLLAFSSKSVLIDFFILITSIFLGVIVYLISIYLLKVEEVTWFINLFKRKFGR